MNWQNIKESANTIKDTIWEAALRAVEKSIKDTFGFFVLRARTEFLVKPYFSLIRGSGSFYFYFVYTFG